MPATLEKPKRKTRPATTRRSPAAGTRTGSHGGDAWLETPESLAAAAEERDILAHPEKHPGWKDLDAFFADLYA